jgi:transposase
MKYTKEERLNIGRRIYDGELSRYAAAEEYGISDQTARDYMRMYKNTNHLPPKYNPRNSHSKSASSTAPSGLEDYEAMTKEELIRELVKTRIAEARLKKGYEVKGAGADKEFVLLGSKNTK